MQKHLKLLNNILNLSELKKQIYQTTTQSSAVFIKRNVGEVHGCIYIYLYDESREDKNPTLRVLMFPKDRIIFQTVSIVKTVLLC